MNYKNFLFNRNLRRGMVAAIVCGCAFSLTAETTATAETYYRVNREEFAAIAPYLKEDFSNVFTFAIASPENGVAMSNAKLNSTPALNIDAIGVAISDDAESMTFNDSENGINYSIESESGSADPYTFNISIRNPNVSDNYLETVTDNGNYKFAFTSSTGTSTAFQLNFDLSNNGAVQLKSGLKNTDLTVGFYETSGGNKYFRLLSESNSKISLYRLDYFNWTIDDSNVENDHQVILSTTPHDNLLNAGSYIDVNYILNDGEDVSFDELIKSPNTLNDIRLRKGQVTNVTIPTTATLAKSTDENNTLWALPVMNLGDQLVPLGKIITKKYGKDGVTTGVVMTTAENQESVYYTLDGRVASTPLASGVYIKLTGNKAEKIIIR